MLAHGLDTINSIHGQRMRKRAIKQELTTLS